MVVYLKIITFLFGLTVGSFLNVVVYRLNKPEEVPFQERKLPPLLGGRSFCPKCKHQLAWRDNIPLLSFLFLRGKCRYCQKPISIQYPLVELVTAILTVVVVFYLPGFHPRGEFCGHPGGVCLLGDVLMAGHNLIITYLLIAIFVSDLLYLTIPDELSYPGIFISGIALFWQTAPLSYLLAGLGAWLFFLALHLITKRKGMAIGDVKLALFLGLFLGWPGTIIALYLAFLTGAMVGGILLLRGTKKLGQPIPFGPFMAAGALLAWCWSEKLFSFYQSWLHLY